MLPVSRLMVAGILSLVLVVGYTAVGALVYTRGPSPLETLGEATNTTSSGPPLYRGLVEGVSNATYLGEAEVEGRPVPTGGHGMLVRVDGLIVVPMAGPWIVEDDGVACHGQIAMAMVGADWVEAEGLLAQWYVPGEGRVTVLVAEKVKIEWGGHEIEAEHMHGSTGCRGWHHHGWRGGEWNDHDND